MTNWNVFNFSYFNLPERAIGNYSYPTTYNRVGADGPLGGPVTVIPVIALAYSQMPPIRVSQISNMFTRNIIFRPFNFWYAVFLFLVPGKISNVTIFMIWLLDWLLPASYTFDVFSASTFIVLALSYRIDSFIIGKGLAIRTIATHFFQQLSTPRHLKIAKFSRSDSHSGYFFSPRVGRESVLSSKRRVLHNKLCINTTEKTRL